MQQATAGARAPAGKWVVAGTVEASAVKLLDHTVNRHAAMMAYDDVFWMMGMLFLVSVPFLCLLGSGRRKNAPG